MGIALVTLAAIAWYLYRPKVQQSKQYQATVVPLANIMDVGFIVLSPIIVLLAGYGAPLVMLGICLLAMATGFVIAYNIRHYEPLEKTDDPINKWGRASRWALTAASIVNIAYYTLILATLILWPLSAYTDTRLSVVGAILLGALIITGMSGGMDKLNRLGDRTTAFNLAAIVAVVVGFIVFNIQAMLGGRWNFPATDTSIDTDDLRKILGFFAIVQGFEASRYIGSQFAAGLRIRTMRVAQVISSVVFVALLAAVLILFVGATTKLDSTAIFVISKDVGKAMPWLILLAALGSEGSAIINATTSRSDMLVNNNVPRRWSFVILLLPAIAIFLLADVTQAVALASRVFAIYYLFQAVMAGILARRAKNWWAVAGFTAIGLAMGTIAIFGLST